MNHDFERMTLRERHDALIAALRSGEWEQGRGCLRHAGDSYCCLGVACEVAGVESICFTDHDDGFYYRFPGRIIRLPESVTVLYGFHTSDGDHATRDRCSLALLNDGGMTFGQIADLLEPMDSAFWARAAA